MQVFLFAQITLNQTWVEYGKKKKPKPSYLHYRTLFLRVCCDQALHRALVSQMVTLQPSSAFAAPRRCRLGQGQKTPSCPQIKNQPYDLTKVVVFSKAFISLVQAKPNRFVRVIGHWNAPLIAMPVFGPYHLYAKLFHELIGFLFFCKYCFTELSFRKAK